MSLGKYPVNRLVEALMIGGKDAPELEHRVGHLYPRRAFFIGFMIISPFSVSSRATVSLIFFIFPNWYSCCATCAVQKQKSVQIF